MARTYEPQPRPEDSGARQAPWSQLLRYWRDEIAEVDARSVLARVVVWPLPTGRASRFRARLLQAVGCAVGERTLIMSKLALIGGRVAWANLVIGSDCFINQDCVFDATGPIVIGDRVSLGQGVLITTSAHATDQPEQRAGRLEPKPVRIGDGAWVASRAVILPGVHVAEGAVVCAGAVVTGAVPAHTMVGGVPARVIRRLPQPDSRGGEFDPTPAAGHEHIEVDDVGSAE
jgi:maltose O-acetyltransferase